MPLPSSAFCRSFSASFRSAGANSSRKASFSSTTVADSVLSVSGPASVGSEADFVSSVGFSAADFVSASFFVAGFTGVSFFPAAEDRFFP